MNPRIILIPIPGRRTAAVRSLLWVALLLALVLVLLLPGQAGAAVYHQKLGSIPLGTETPAGARVVAVEESTGDLFVAVSTSEGPPRQTTVRKFDPSENPPTAATTYIPDPITPVIGSGLLHTVGGIAVDQATGNIYASNTEVENVVYEFSPSGVLLATNHLAGAGSNHAPRGIALDAAGDLYVANNETGFSGVYKYLPDGEPDPLTPVFGAGILHQPAAVALASAGDVYVSDNGNGNQEFSGVFKFSPAAEPDPSNPVLPGRQAQNLAIDPSAGDIYQAGSGGIYQSDPSGALLGTIAGSYAAVAVDGATGVVYGRQGQSRVDVFGPAVIVPDVETRPATELAPQAATLNGAVDPLGEGAVDCRFAWGETEALTEPPIPCEPETVPDGSASAPVHARLSGLAPDTTYHFRLEVENANGPNEGEPSETMEFTTPGPGLHGVWAADVASTSATLAAKIDPHGLATSYRFQYLTEAEYAANGGSFAGAHPAAEVPFPEASIGAGEADVAVSQHLQGLQPDAAYRYRLLVTNSAVPGGYPSSTLAFTTQGPSGPLLPDGRGWELVSPANKHGASIGAINEPSATNGSVIEAAADGAAMTYVANAPTESGAPGNSSGVQVLSAHGPEGWASRDISSPHEAATGIYGGGGNEYRFFSQDLSLGLLQPQGPFTASLSPAASEQGPYLRTIFPASESASFCTSSCYRPLVTGCPEAGQPCPAAVEALADVPPGTKFGESEAIHPGTCVASFCGPRFEGATADLSHVVFTGPALTSAAPAGATSLYEYSASAPPAEAIQLLSVLPGGQPSGGVPRIGSGEASSGRHAISADGSRVVWAPITGTAHLYLRDTALQQTVQLDAVVSGAGAGVVEPRFQAAAADGSEVFFTDHQALTADSGAGQASADLYRCRIAVVGGELRCDLTDLTPQSAGEAAAVRGGVLGASANGSYLYFVAEGNLTGTRQNPQGAAAEPGEPNLYLYHEGATVFIATLSGEDFPDWEQVLANQPVRVSPEGHYLAFMSARPLTGYDNRDAVSGQPDEEVYLYHAAAAAGEPGSLACASCVPTGARPAGVEFGETGSPGNVMRFVSGQPDGGIWKSSTWLAATVPGWTQYRLATAVYQSRYLSDSGRLFFNTADALVPADTNGGWDVYEFEPNAVGSCSESGPNHLPAAGGCIGLISSGASPRPSVFLDASENGDDAFFLTLSRLTPADEDASYDVYDARVGGGEGEPPKPVECSGDACQQPATPPGEPTPGSLTFNGAGNVKECPKGKVKRSGRCVGQKARKHHKKSRNHHKKANTKKGRKQKDKRVNGSRGGAG